MNFRPYFWLKFFFTISFLSGGSRRVKCLSLSLVKKSAVKKNWKQAPISERFHVKRNRNQRDLVSLNQAPSPWKSDSQLFRASPHRHSHSLSLSPGLKEKQTKIWRRKKERKMRNNTRRRRKKRGLRNGTSRAQSITSTLCQRSNKPFPFRPCIRDYRIVLFLSFFGFFFFFGLARSSLLAGLTAFRLFFVILKCDSPSIT